MPLYDRRAVESVEPYLQGEEMYLATYGDGLNDLELPVMIDTFRRNHTVAFLLLVQPTASPDIVPVTAAGTIAKISALTREALQRKRGANG